MPNRILREGILTSDRVNSLGPDGDRDQVCDCFEKHYAPHKESFANHGGELRGKVLACHCFPERCHGNGLINIFDL